MKNQWKRLVTLVAMLAMVGVFVAWRRQNGSADSAVIVPPRDQVDADDTGSGELSMSDVLDMAVAARQHMAENLDDYTARFVKREVDTKGVLGGETEILMKVQTRLRGDTEEAPLRVYLHFQSPESVNGREVIWGEDLYDGKMAVHEVGLLLSLKTIWLDPNGMIAMQGQRYPISEIGMVRLVEKLIERGEQDRNDPDVKVTLVPDHTHDDQPAQLIQVRRGKPTGSKDDFSLAEIVIDPERQLVLSYRSFGWPDDSTSEAPLLEAYAYHDVQVNVGLTRDDFDPQNPEYNFPAF